MATQATVWSLNQNLTQHRIAISTRKSRIPRWVICLIVNTKFWNNTVIFQLPFFKVYLYLTYNCGEAPSKFNDEIHFSVRRFKYCFLCLKRYIITMNNYFRHLRHTSKILLEVFIYCTWKCRFATASTFGKIQVEIISASIWTAIKSTVQTANVTRRGVGIWNNKKLIIYVILLFSRFYYSCEPYISRKY